MERLLERCAALDVHKAQVTVRVHAVEQVQSSTFTISIDFERIGTDMPRIREIVGPIQEWLDKLDPDEALASDMYPSRSIEIRDWELELMAFPLEPEHRGPIKHIIGVGPTMVGNVNDTEKLRATPNRKRGKYGTLREPLLLPS
jgi:hypothetical protein